MKTKLSDCVEILDSLRVPLSSAERASLDKVYPYYGAQGIIDYVDKYIFDGEYILVAEDGNNLKTLNESIATWATGKFWVNNHAHILGEKTGFCLRFIYYLLQSVDLRGYITGSAQPKLTQDNLARVELDLPDYDVQCRVAHALTLIDSKIANNNAICSNLESLSKLLYDYWFVQFDFPDENGRPYKSSGGKMVWNEELKRDIPDGWEVKPLGDVLSFSKGKIPNELLDTPSNEFSSPYITIDVANNGMPQYCNPELMVKCDGEVIMVMDGAASGDIYIGNIGSLGSTFSMLKSKRSDITDALIYMILKANMPIYKRANTGSTVPHANRTFIEKMPVGLPKEASHFGKIFDVLFERIRIGRNENQQLASLRDFLLPMLMNGQVKVVNME